MSLANNQNVNKLYTSYVDILVLYNKWTSTETTNNVFMHVDRFLRVDRIMLEN